MSRPTLLALALVAAAACTTDPTIFSTGNDGGTDGAVDAAGGPVELVVTPTTMTVIEGQSQALMVSLSARPADAVLVTLSTSDDTKLGLAPTALLFSTTDWATPQPIALTGKADADVSDEAVTVTLRSTAIAGDVTVAVTVDDDDGLALALSPMALDITEGATGTVRGHLTAQPTADVTVAVASTNLLAATVTTSMLTFTPANWAIDQTITINGVQDANTVTDTAMITFTSPDLTAAAVTVSVSDNDVLGITTSSSALTLNEGATGTFTVALTQVPPGPVMVTVVPGAGTIATGAPGTLNFTTANWSTAQTVTVTAVSDDDVADGATTINLAATGLAPRSVAITVNDDDVQALVPAPTTVAVTEGASAPLGVRLAFRPAADVAVSASSLATAIATVTPASLTFSPSNYATPQALTVAAPQDADAAPATTSVRLDAAGLGLTRDVTVNVTDDDTLGIDTDVTTVAVTEGATTTYQVRLTAQPLAGTTVTIATSDATAATVTPASLVFTTTTWNTYQTVTVTGTQDVDLVGETVTLTASSAGLTNRVVTATITDNDTQIVQVSTATATVTEGGIGTVGVTLGFVPTASVTVMISSSATAAATVSPATMTFTPATYATAQTLTITGVEDADALNGAATVALTATAATAASVAVTVTDNDALNIDATPTSVSIGEAGTGTIMVRLTAMPPGPTSVSVTSGDPGAATATPGTLSFSTSTWMTYQSVTVAGVDDADTGNEVVNVTLASAGLTNRTVTVNVSDNDVLGIQTSVPTVSLTEGGTATFQARLSAMPAGAVTVTLGSTDPSAATAAPATLAFSTANWMTYQTVTVTGVQDVDLAGETASINLTAPSVTSAAVTATVADNDTQVVQTSTTAVSVAEGGATTVGVTLGFQPAGNAVVSISSGSTLIATATPASLTFTPANYATAQTISIAGAEDANATNDSTSVSLTAPAATAASVAVTVLDNDTLAIDVTPTSLTIGEAGSGVIQVRLTAMPGGTTVVNAGSTDPGAATVDRGSLSFTTANWSSYQNLTVAGVNDGDTSNENLNVNLTSAPLAPRAVAVTVIDDDTCGNGVCSGGETCGTCPADCGSCCGNGVCSGGETCSTCPADCGACVFCGDGTCNGGENCATCPGDCGSCCGNGACDNGENCATCANDCGSCCGNGVCDNGENCATCANDCGSCCGNGTCDNGETCATCTNDCGSCCGNGTCDNGEDCGSCGVDCGSCCGNGLCDFGEDCFSCSFDCGSCGFCGDGTCDPFECCWQDCGPNPCE